VLADWEWTLGGHCDKTHAMSSTICVTDGAGLRAIVDHNSPQMEGTDSASQQCSSGRGSLGALPRRA